MVLHGIGGMGGGDGGGGGGGDWPKKSHYDEGADADIELDEEEEEDTSDEEYDPLERLINANRRAKKRIRKNKAGKYGINDMSNSLKGKKTQRFSTKFGPMSMRRGRGKQPYVQSRKGDYGGKRVGTKYSEFVPAMSRGVNQRQMARDVSSSIRGGNPDTSGYSDRQRRGANHFMGITQIAEDDTNRTPGSGKLARGGLQMVQDGEGTFSSLFSGANAPYVPARGGGTGAMRDLVAGRTEPDDATLDMIGNMSSSSSESSSEESESSGDEGGGGKKEKGGGKG